MQQYTYLIINFFIILFPFLFSFESKLSFYKHWKQLFIAILPVSLLFIAWDVVATARGHWSFNPDYVTGIKLLNLPVEEVLFFITVPYSCLFLYEAVSWYSQKNSLTVKRQSLIDEYFKHRRILEKMWLLVVSTFGVAIFILLTTKLEYTGIVLLVSAATSLCIGQWIKDREYAWWMTLCLILFFVTNSFLTALPVVMYGAEFNIGARVGTIPVEDFVYNWSLLNLYLYSYRKVGEQLFSKRNSVK